MNNKTPAQAIKEELKKAFPNIKFSVRYKTFSMGDSVDISYQNGVPTSEIEKITNKYEAGSFDSMTDMYEYNNNRNDIPQTKYIMINREVDSDKKLIIKKELALKWGIQDIENENEWKEKTGFWSDQKVWTVVKVTSF